MTEIGLVNPDDSPARVDIDSVRSDGAVVAARPVTLASRGALAGSLADLFDVSFGSAAMLCLRSDRPVVCHALVSRASDNSRRLCARVGTDHLQRQRRRRPAPALVLESQ